MASPALADIRTRIDRANKHIDDLKKFLPGRELAKITGDLATIKRQSDGKTYDIVVKVVDPPPDLRIAIGEVIHALRASLDYLAYQLALRNGFPATGRTTGQLKALRKLSFLIHSDAARFSSAAGKVTPLIGKVPVAEMEKLQPYKGLNPRGAILWRLSELDNITKHRVLAAIQQVLNHAKVTVRIGEQDIVGTVVNPHRQALKDGAKLISFMIDAAEQPPKVDVNVESVMEVVFTDTDGLCDGANVFQVMRDSVNLVTSIVDDFEKLFF